MSDDKKTDDKKPQMPAAGAPQQPEIAKKVEPIHPMRVSLVEHKEQALHIQVPYGIEPRDMLPVAYWTHIAQQLTPFTHIHAYAEDGAWYAEFMVRDNGVNWAKVALLREVRLEKINPERRIVILPGHTVGWAGTFSKWRVIRDADNQVLRSNFATEGEAYAWLSEYAKSVAA